MAAGLAGSVVVLIAACDLRPAAVRENVHGLSPIHIAAREGDIEALEAMLAEEGVEPDVADAEGVTPLLRAVRNGHLRVARLLLEAGARPGARSKTGYTPLHLAAREGDVELVSMLMQYGARADVPTEEGRLPVHLAAARGHGDALSMLLRDWEAYGGGGAEAKGLRRRDEAGDQPLHLAVDSGSDTAALALLAAGADPNAPAGDDWLPLQKAVEQGDAALAGALLGAGADPLKPGPGSQTPWETARQTGDQELMATLWPYVNTGGAY